MKDCSFELVEDLNPKATNADFKCIHCGRVVNVQNRDFNSSETLRFINSRFIGRCKRK